MRTLVGPALLLAPLAACSGNTGGGLVQFDAYAAGPADAPSPFTFTTAKGFEVTLTTATMHIGAVYLTASAFGGGSQTTACIEPGRYVAQVPGGVDINLLSPAPQPFSVPGSGTLDTALTGEIWLTHDDISATDDSPVVIVKGTAKRDTTFYPFIGAVTIGANRAKPITDPAQPGLNPICKRRIIQVAPIAVSVAPNASLYVRVDPRAWFDLIDFSQLPGVASAHPDYPLPDSDQVTPVGDLLQGIANGAQHPYSFSFQ